MEVVFHEELITISHDDVTTIQLCIYRDTPKSACLSAVPSHSQVPHPLCMSVCMCNRRICHPSYLCKTLMGQHPPPFAGFMGGIIPSLQSITVLAVGVY